MSLFYLRPVYLSLVYVFMTYSVLYLTVLEDGPGVGVGSLNLPAVIS